MLPLKGGGRTKSGRLTFPLRAARPPSPVPPLPPLPLEKPCIDPRRADLALGGVWEALEGPIWPFFPPLDPPPSTPSEPPLIGVSGHPERTRVSLSAVEALVAA